ncbi:hypothetical protein FB45DRAFT_1071326 [Roridomyces roridus]|uniref:F-box domain-containing protein n=1 Tax=Roridomyces roridus TaxID=1738132 RepID=A0AAD7AXR8_9AGAR|nr:hypothetical protein FB45DRAFT_1071326 [Roridomyces roridus]
MAGPSIGAELRRRAAHIEDQIDLLQSHIATLQAEGKAVQEQLAAIVYPILTLPNDITSEIFLQYSDDYPTTSCSPLILARVCSSWRQVALSTHGIWAHFACGRRFSCSPAYAHHRDPFVPLSGRLAFWISRAGKLPLHIRIKLPGAELPECTKILEILGAYAEQWGSLEIISDGPILFPLQIQGPLPCLTDLKLWTHSPFYGATMFPTLHDASLLRQVHLWNIDLNNYETVLPWSQITTLHLDSIDLAQALDILSQTENLETLVSHLDVDPDEPITSPPHILARLHTLTVGFADSCTIFPHITLPVLRKLQLSSPTEDSALEIESLIGRSSCSPTTLILAECKDTSATTACLSVISVIPTIQKLEVAACAFKSTALAEFFDRIHDDPSFLPALTSLDINNCETRIELSPLVRMLKKRREIGGVTAQLTSFVISFEQEWYDDYYSEMDVKKLNSTMQRAIDKLDELRAGGLKLDMRSSFKWFHEFVDSKVIEEISAVS